MYDVVALGELLIDFTCQSTDAEGYPTMAAHPGGAPANFLAAVAKFGGTAAMVGKVGNDAFGKLLLGTLQAAGISTNGMIVDDSVFTTLAFVTLDETGDREFSFARKPGADTQIRFEEINMSVIDGAKVLHFGTLSLTDEPARTGTYETVVRGIAAKDLDQTVYVAAGYVSGGTSYCTGVLAYSIGSYCVSQAATADAISPFAQATAVYGYYAKQYFR